MIFEKIMSVTYGCLIVSAEDDDFEFVDDDEIIDEESEVEVEPPIYERPEYIKARSRLLFLWDWAHGSKHYNKKDWQYLDGRLSHGDDPDEVLQQADHFYELSQDISWPSHFE